jgi:riboflavin kinase / FMN adenylyltransferase
VVLTFDERRSKESAEDFVNEVLVGLLRTKLVVVGADFHFGHGRAGNVALLEQMGAELGFEVLGLGLVAPQPGSVAFSSTRVRELLAAGDVEGAAEVLGRPHELRGTLVAAIAAGIEPGTELAVDDRMCMPAAGRYTGTLTQGDGPSRPAVISIGGGTTSIANIPLVVVRSGPAAEPAPASGPAGIVRLIGRLDGFEPAAGH